MKMKVTSYGGSFAVHSRPLFETIGVEPGDNVEGVAFNNLMLIGPADDYSRAELTQFLVALSEHDDES